LHALAQGITVFATDFPTLTSEWGLALVFAFEDAATADKLNLRDPVLQIDTAPLVSECQCYTCGRHSRAYIHHLLNTHEMLAVTLLQLHNWFHYLSWFAWLRSRPVSEQFAE
jgi:queuine tRNA-ribosyltransferase subunit QTRTD1